MNITLVHIGLLLERVVHGGENISCMKNDMGMGKENRSNLGLTRPVVVPLILDFPKTPNQCLALISLLFCSFLLSPISFLLSSAPSPLFVLNTVEGSMSRPLVKKTYEK